MVRLHHALSLLSNLEDHDIIVVPSMTYKFYETLEMSIIFEERALALLKLLDNKGSRFIFVISSPLELDIIKYRLSMYAEGAGIADIEDRFVMITPNDDSNRSLTEKLLEREEVLAEIRSNIRDLKKSILIPFICTDLEVKLKEEIGIPTWLGSPPSHWGFKSGSRQIFTESRVPLAQGILEPVFDVAALEEAMLTLIAQSTSKSVIVKLDDGSGGYGNVVVDFHASEITKELVRVNLRTAVEKMMDYENFCDKVKECGAIVEEMIKAKPGFKQTCPSVQLFISNDGKVQLISSHEQVINVCTYEGCRFPADEHYKRKISKYAYDAGVVLSSKNIRGFFGVDFLATQWDSENWDVIALEINLRLCATTFTYFALLTAVDPLEADKKHYLAVDEAKLVRKLSVHELVAEMKRLGLAFDHQRGRGVFLTALAHLSSLNEVNLICIGDSIAEAAELREKFADSFMREPLLKTFPAPVPSASIRVLVASP